MYSYEDSVRDLDRLTHSEMIRLMKDHGIEGELWDDVDQAFPPADDYCANALMDFLGY